MITTLLSPLLGLALALTGFLGIDTQKFGAFSDPFLSVQLATSPSNGNCLTTDGTNNIWSAGCGGSGGGITSLGALNQAQTGASQVLASSTTGTDFTITSSGNTHTFNLPVASGSNTGKLSSTDWTTFNSKESVLTFSWPLVRTTNTISWGGLSTTTALTTGHIPFVSGANTFSSRATTSVSCSGSVSCTAFDVLGSSPITITGSGLTSYDAWTHGAAGKSATTSAIGIGSSTPWGMLSVTQTGTYPSFIVEDSASPDSSPFIIDATGNVGIGTTGPLRLLHVGAGADTPVIATNGLYVSNNGSTAITWRDSTNNIEGSLQADGQVYIGSASAHNLVLRTGNTDRVTIDTTGNVGIGTTGPGAKLHIVGLSQVAAINNTAFRVSSSNDNTKSLFIGFDTTTGVDAGYIQSAIYGGAYKNLLLNPISGNVGIGTTGPLTELHVRSSDDTELRIDSSSSENDAILRLTDGNSPTGEGLKIWYDSSVGDAYIDTLYNNDVAALHFRTKGTSERLTILGSGNVGIGTTTPAFKLDVYGAAGVASSIRTHAASTGGVLIGYGGNDIQGRTSADQNGNLSLNPYAGNVGVGTTTPNFKLVSTNSTGPQLSLSAGAGLNQWVMRNEGGELAFATSTYTATSSVSALRIDSNGKVRANCFTNDGTTCISGGSGASTTLLADLNSWSKRQDFSNATSTLFSAATAWITNLIGTLTGTGIFDFGGADSFEIPNGTANTLGQIGQVAFDTSDNQILIATTTANTPRVIPTMQRLWGATIASTSVDFVSGGRIWLPPQRDGFDVVEIHCAVDGGTSVVINVSNSGGTTDSETLTCDADGATDTSIDTNSVYAAGSLNSLEIGTITGTVDYLTFSIYGLYTRE